MDQGPVKIYTSGVSPRLSFITDLILNEILGLSCEIITDRRRIGKYPVINYSGEEIKGAFKISPAAILFEKGIRDQDIEITRWNNLPVFFRCQSDSDIPFDIFAASFYMVSRYEEYLDFEPDEFGRFPASASLAYKNGFLEQPVVDLWVRELAKALVRKYHNLAFRRNEYRELVTFDMDEPFAYLGKNLIGDIGGFLHDITASKGQASHRFGCLAKGEKDPYEVLDYIFDSVVTNNTPARVFFPVGDHSDHDLNPSWKNDDYRDLITGTENKSDIGIHPSFKACTDLPELRKELTRLRTITGTRITKSRFHFLRISMPYSYTNLSGTGINEDYSMGFPDEVGFRAGIARPFFFYNVSDDEPSDLRIIPFQVMDITLKEYKKMNPDTAIQVITKAKAVIKNVGGLFISIWHNTTLLDTPDGRKWRSVFEYTLREKIS
jgi:hypothetical protein